MDKEENNLNREPISYGEAMNQSMDYFDGGSMEASNFLNKYALREGEEKVYEYTPDHMHKRLAGEFHRVEKKYPNETSEEKLYELMKDFEGPVPQGSVMSACGNPFQVMSLSNCFVVRETDADSYGNILKTDQELAQIMKRRGGVGTDLSHLRPRGTKVQNAARTSTGAASFAHRYSDTTREVAQNNRRGALMLTIDCRHPDVEEFVNLKAQDETAVTGANISVKVRDEFMEAVEAEEEYTLRWPVECDPEEADVTKKIDAKELFQNIVKNNYGPGDIPGGEPGTIWIDQIHRESPANQYPGMKEISTNPCGEVPLPDGDACRLLAINLFAYVENPFEEDAYFDFERFAEEVRYSQRMMDDIVDLEIEAVDRILQKVKDDPEEEVVKGIEKHLWKRIKEQAINWRRTGLGTTALGDTLAALGYRYASDESFEVVDEIYRTLKLSAYRESVELAKERGAFPSWDESVESEENPFLWRIKQEDPELFEDMMKHGRRNVAILTNAPTGTVSTLCQTTSGIENMYAPSFFRKRKINHDEDVEPDYVDETGDEWIEFPVFKEKFKLWMEKNGYDTDNVEQYSPEDVDRMKKESPYDGATVEDVDWRKKVELQGVIQRHIDHSISVTTNLPEDVPMDVVEDVYMRSWKSGCKGCTIFRDGSRDSVLSNESVKDQDGKISHTDAPERPEVLDCKIHQIRYRGDNWKILVGFLEEDPYEVFAIKTGGDTGVNIRFVNSENEGFEQGKIRKHGGGVYDLEAKDGKVVIEDINSYAPDDEVRGMTRMLSLSLRHGTPIRYVIEQLEKADGSIVSFTRSVLQALRQYMPDGEEATNGETCIECGSENVIYVEGCLKCQDCGSGKCG
jgi:ribonucleoside-diphosphate reductase alpha chain